jgi:hypothetical protein
MANTRDGGRIVQVGYDIAASLSFSIATGDLQWRGRSRVKSRIRTRLRSRCAYDDTRHDLCTGDGERMWRRQETLLPPS